MRPLLANQGSSRPTPRLEFRVSSHATGCGFAVAASSLVVVVVVDSRRRWDAVRDPARSARGHLFGPRRSSGWTGSAEAV